MVLSKHQGQWITPKKYRLNCRMFQRNRWVSPETTLYPILPHSHCEPYWVYIWPVKKFVIISLLPSVLNFSPKQMVLQFPDHFNFADSFQSLPFFQTPSTQFILKNNRTPGLSPWDRDTPGATLVSSYHRKWRPPLHHQMVFLLTSTYLLQSRSVLPRRCSYRESLYLWSNSSAQSRA